MCYYYAMKTKSDALFHSLTIERAPSRALLQEAKQMLEREPVMRQALFTQALRAFFSHDFELAHHLLRTLIHGSMGFEALSEQLNIPSKSLLRMLSARGNPTSKHLFRILGAVQRHQHMTLHIEVQIPSTKNSIGELA